MVNITTEDGVKHEYSLKLSAGIYLAVFGILCILGAVYISQIGFNDCRTQCYKILVDVKLKCPQYSSAMPINSNNILSNLTLYQGKS